MRNEPARAAFLDAARGRVPDVVFEYMISRFRKASLLPSLLAWLWLLFPICTLV